MKNTRISMLKDAPQRLLDGARVSIDRLPMLRAIFERMASQCADALRQWSSCPALFYIDSIGCERIGDVLDSWDGNAVFGLFYVQAWDSRILIGLEHALAFGLAEALFGGDGTAADALQRRQLSNIELRLAEKTFGLFASALQTSFASVCQTAFRLDRVETRVDFVALGSRTAFGVKTKIRVRILGHDSAAFVLIPQAALNSIRQDLARDLTAESSIRDPRWTKQIHKEIVRTEIEVRGVIEEDHLTLADLAGLTIGGVLPLRSTARSRVKLMASGEPLFWCNLGQAEGFYTLQVDEIASQEQELIDSIVPP